MRSILYVVLAAAGLAGLAVLFVRVSAGRRGAPAREAERLLDRCQEMLTGIENATRALHSPEAAGP